MKGNVAADFFLFTYVRYPQELCVYTHTHTHTHTHSHTHTHTHTHTHSHAHTHTHTHTHSHTHTHTHTHTLTHTLTHTQTKPLISTALDFLNGLLSSPSLPDVFKLPKVGVDLNVTSSDGEVDHLVPPEGKQEEWRRSQNHVLCEVNIISYNNICTCILGENTHTEVPGLNLVFCIRGGWKEVGITCRQIN